MSFYTCFIRVSSFHANTCTHTHTVLFISFHSKATYVQCILVNGSFVISSHVHSLLTQRKREGEKERLMMRKIEEERLMSDRLLFDIMTALHI